MVPILEVKTIKTCFDFFFFVINFVLKHFSDIIWVIISVSEGGTLALTQQLHQLSTSQATDEQM